MKPLARYVVNLIFAILPPTRFFSFKRVVWRNLGISVGNGAKINSGAKVWGSGRISVGAECWLGINLTVIVPAGATVTIGSNVDIGPDVLIECGSHEIGGAARRAGRGQVADVEVGAGSWIGCRVTLLGGAKIGAGTIVAAGSVVLAGKYPDNALLAGVPARVSRIINKSDYTPK